MTDPRTRRTGTIHRYAPAKPGEEHGHYIVRCSAPGGTRAEGYFSARRAAA
jgi:hypothetical protein